MNCLCSIRTFGNLWICSYTRISKGSCFKSNLQSIMDCFRIFPKWGGTFPETQLLSTFILMCYVFTDMVLKSKRVSIRILKLLFIVSIIYLQSKSAIIGLTVYLIFSISKVYRYIFSPIAIFGVVYFIYKAGSKEFASMLNFSSLESMALQYYSFSERLFHIIKSIEYMSHNIIQLLLDLVQELMELLYPWNILVFLDLTAML